MKYKKHDQANLKKEFLKSEFQTPFAFFKAKFGEKKAKTGALGKISKGWGKEKQNLKLTLVDGAREKIIEQTLKDETAKEGYDQILEKSLKAENKIIDLALNKIENGEIAKVELHTTKEDGRKVTKKVMSRRELNVKELSQLLPMVRLIQGKETEHSKLTEADNPAKTQAIKNLTKAIKSNTRSQNGN